MTDHFFVLFYTKYDSLPMLPANSDLNNIRSKPDCQSHLNALVDQNAHFCVLYSFQHSSASFDEITSNKDICKKTETYRSC